MLRGDPTETVPKLVEDTGASLLVTDFGPLRLGREWRQKARHIMDYVRAAHASMPFGRAFRNAVVLYESKRIRFRFPVLHGLKWLADSTAQPHEHFLGVQIADAVSVPFHEVDAHNVVPCWHASDKRETGARTIRSKINKQVPEFLEVSACRTK